MIKKYFYCSQCKRYYRYAKAFTNGVDVEFSCLKCGYKVVIKEEPCDHMWQVDIRDAIFGKSYPTTRVCKECGTEEEGEIMTTWLPKEEK